MSTLSTTSKAAMAVLMLVLGTATGLADPQVAVRPPKDMAQDADALLAAGEWQKAYDLIARILAIRDRRDYAEIPSWHQKLYFKQGWCALKLQKWAEAMNNFQMSYQFTNRRENPYQVLALRGWADAAMGAGDKETALRIYRKYVEEASTNNWKNPFRSGAN